jgi:serine/threonine protein kinase
MEKIEGQNLEEWVEQYGKISQKLALNWLTQLLEILKYLHENHFFHRDIKPTNIIIRPDGQLVLIDFGSVREVSSTYLSKLSAGFKQEEFYEPSVTITGTAGYIPLEQVNGKVIPQSDFYALGRTIVHLVTGIHPINLLEDDKTGKLIWRNQAPHISNTFANLLEWLMEPRIFKRPLNAQTILQELSRWFHFKLKLESLSKTIYFRSTATVLVAVLGWGAYNGFLLWRVSSLADQGLRNLLKQQYSDAKSNFEEALKLKPKDTDLHYSLGQACERLGDDNCSLTQYKLAIQLNENNWEAHQSIGLFYDRNDQLSDAEKHYQKAMELEPLITDIAINNLARLKNLQPNYDDAIDLIEQGLKISTVPEIRASYYKNLGWAQFKLGDYDQAISSLQASLRLDPKFPGTYCLIVKVQKASGKPIEQETLGKCVTSEHDQPEVNQWRRELVFNRDDK